jgi:hypothetical protein
MGSGKVRYRRKADVTRVDRIRGLLRQGWPDHFDVVVHMPGALPRPNQRTNDCL